FFSFICDADFLLNFDLFFAVLLNRVYEHEFSCKINRLKRMEKHRAAKSWETLRHSVSLFR
ncbi:hypothetical protein, partial [Parasutterella excrementihominis]